MSNYRIGLIGGSGLYHIRRFPPKQKWVGKVKTPFGAPSDDYLTGELAGREVVFLPRHARGHRILPSELNHRANIYGMKKLNVAWIIRCQRCRLAPGEIPALRHCFAGPVH